MADVPARSSPYHASHWTADRLRISRRLAGWSQRQLAARAGVHVQTVKYWERRESVIGGWAVRRFRDAFAAAGMEWQGPPAPQALGTLVSAIDDARATNVWKALHWLPTPFLSRCGAKTRKGTACRCQPIPGRRRCKFHGGLSTGPKTPEGRERIREALRRRSQAGRGKE